MTEDRDQIDAWLEREVAPLLPRPGSLDRIRRSARRRKTTQAVLAAAGCVVIIAAAVVVPQLTGAFSQHGSGRGLGAAASGSTPPASAQPAGSGTPTSSGSGPVSTQPSHTYLYPPSAGGPVPVGFQPTSVTFVGTGTGGVVGAVIGQAGDHHCSTRFCTSLAGTSDYGGAWYGVSAPLTDSVSQLRFAKLKDGWAYGPQLWETSGGGWPWHQEYTFGMDVVGLEAAPVRAFAIFAQCAGTATDYAADCTSFSLYSSAPGSTSWTRVPVPAAFRPMKAATPSSAMLVISGSTGYLLTPSGALLRGSVTGGPWKQFGPGLAPCTPGPAQPSGLPADAQLASWRSPTMASSALVLACDSHGSSGYLTTVWISATGAQWTEAGTVTTAAPPTSLSATPNGHFVLATQAGIYYSTHGGKSWQSASIPGRPTGGFSYVGMTTNGDGVAVPADAALGEIFVTTTGGSSWERSLIAG